ncbi:MAG TPA: NAD(P)-binding domain-containing protein, partial [Stackebrandtia sp.]|uniref:NAD(P)-dependent oxidoreductase n=1 Tax=Stackebrandtia sp. TaxID=2023065 RepID=UPI002D4EA988
LRDAGFDITAWNRDTRRADPLRAHGVAVAASPAEAVARAEAVIVNVAGAEAVHDILLGAGDAAAHIDPSTVVLQMSTIGPEATARLARALPEAVRLLDAPVKGSTPAVLAGTLGLLIGGSDDDIAAARPVLDALGTVVHCGEVGAGAAAKLLVNAALIASVTSLAEVAAVAEGLGIDEDQRVELLGATPLAGVLASYTGTGGNFPVYLAAKDLHLAVRSAAGEVPALRAMADTLDAAASEPDKGLWTVAEHLRPAPDKGDNA